MHVTIDRSFVSLLQIDVYDVDSDNLSNYSEHDYLGFVVFQLGQLMAARGCVLDQPMNKKTGEKRTKARIIVRGDELKNSQDFAHVQFSCRNLEKMDFFGKSVRCHMLIYCRAFILRCVSSSRSFSFHSLFRVGSLYHPSPRAR